MTSRATALTQLLVCQLRLTPSHFSGVVTIRSALATALMSGVTSPVNSTTLQQKMSTHYLNNSTTENVTGQLNILQMMLYLQYNQLYMYIHCTCTISSYITYFFPSFCSILTFQSSILSLTKAFNGAIYTAYVTQQTFTKISTVLKL